MYNDIGKKIKSLAKVLCVLGVIASLISGIVFISATVESVSIGLLIILVGPIISLVSSWVLYGFGELVDKVCEYGFRVPDIKENEELLNIDGGERLAEIERLRSQKMITEEEYRQAIHKKQ